jgi:ribokinase
MFLHVSDDPERDWHRIAPYAIHETNSYGRWLAAAGIAGPYSEMSDTAALRASGAYAVLTPDECVRLAAEQGQLTLHPLMGGLDPDIAAESLALALRARARGARVVLNPAPAAALPDAWLRAIDVLIVNETEAGEIARPLALPASPAEFAAALSARHGIVVVATLGRDGAYAAAGGIGYGVPALEVDARDTVGAGDAFAGTFAAALDRGESVDVALAVATAAGSIACTRPGAQAALPDAAETARAAAQLQSALSRTTL